MRFSTLALALALASAALLAACGGGGPAGTSQQKAGATPAAENANRAGANGNRPDLGVVPSHGGGAQQPAAPSAPAAGGAASQASAPTTEFDAKVEKAEAKAKGAGASAADRKAAADAYFERANYFFNAGNPTLYRYALRDYRVGLRYDSSNTEARGRMDEIVRIYQSMGRPVPDLGSVP